MEGYFDFTNYTYNGLLTLFTAIIGLAFPFILQVIHRLQDIYHTDKVLDWFMEENEYKRFFLLLRCGVVLAIIMPLALYLIGNILWLCVTILTIHTLFTCLLLFCIIRLYQVVMAYSRCLQLVQRSDAENLEKITFLMLVADEENNIEAYTEAKDKVYETLYKRIISAIKNGHRKELYIQGDLLSAITKIFASAENKAKYPRTAKDITIIHFLYDGVIVKTHLPDETYELIWRELNMMVKTKNDIWLQGYWECASQYDRSMKYDLNEYNSKEEKHLRLIHYFLGALLLGSRYEEMLKYILNFNDVSPDPPRLLLNSLKEIVNVLVWADRQSYEPFGLAKPFHMYFIPIDVNVDNKIYDTLCDYVILSLLLLPTYKMYGSGNWNNYDIPNTASKEKIEHLRLLFKHINAKFKTDANKYEKYLPKYSKFSDCSSEALGYLDSLLLQCDDIVKNIDDNDDVDPEKLKKLKREIIKEYDRQKPQIEMGIRNWEESEDIKFTISSRGQATEGQLMKRQNIPCINFETGLIAILRNKFYEKFSRLFLYNSPVSTVLIQYKDITRALTILGVNESSELINMGVSLWGVDVKDLRVHNMGSGNNTLYLLKAENVPTYTLDEIKCENGLVSLDKERRLYWIEPSKENNLFVTMVQSVVIHKPKWMKYLKINITYDVALGSCDLDRLQNIKNILM